MMDDLPETPVPPRRGWRRFFQFGVGSILLLMLAVGLGMGIIEGQRRHYKATGDAVRDIKELGGSVTVEPLGPAWWHAIIGEDHVRVTHVSLPAVETTDGDLHLVSGFSELKHLDLHNAHRVYGRGLKYLANLRNLESLSLHGTNINDKHLEPLNNLSKLKRLSLHGTYVTGEGLQHLSRAPLEVLSLQSTRLASEHLEHLAPFRHTLRSLNMRNCNLAGTVELADFSRLKDLQIQVAYSCKRLYLHNLPELIGAISLNYMPENLSLAQLPKVLELQLSSNAHRAPRVTIDDLPQLRGLTWEGSSGDLALLRGTPQLASLKLTARPTSRLIEQLATLHNLEQLRWSLPSLRAAEEIVLPIQAWPQLRHLEIFGSQVHDRMLSQIDSAANLTHLNAALTSITQATLARLAGVPLTFLSLDRDKYIDDMALAHLAGHASLTYLNLNGTAVSDAGLEHLQGCAQLRHLSLTRTKITDAGLQNLSKLPLENLELNETSITGDGLKYLASAGQLYVIQLTQTPLTDVGLSHLGKIASLTEIQLANTKISSAGLSHLHNMPHLKRLNLTGANVTTEAIDALEASLAPEITIWHRGYRRKLKNIGP